MPMPDVFSERKSSSMMTIGKRNFIDSSNAKRRGSGQPRQREATAHGTEK
jgi:hypothetical protein